MAKNENLKIPETNRKLSKEKTANVNSYRY